jgi:hypothetical protein
MIIVNLINGRTLACRGGLTLGLARRILFTLRLPMPMQSFTSDDNFLVKPAAVSHFGFIADEVAVARKTAADNDEALKNAKANRIVHMPGLRNPGGQRN